MPIPFIVGGVIAAGKLAVVSGAILAAKGGINTAKAVKTSKDSKHIMMESQEKLDETRTNTNEQIILYGQRKAEICSEILGNFIKDFERIKNITFDGLSAVDAELKNAIETLKIDDIKILVETGKGLITGGASGVGVAALTGFAVNGAVSMIGFASTGAAISGLSGAAAANATLAWLGGGALAANGGGMAAGAAVLGGLVMGPALLIGGGLFSAKATKCLEDARSNNELAKLHAKEMDVAGKELQKISEITNEMKCVINNLGEITKISNNMLTFIVNKECDFDKYDQYTKEQVLVSFKNAQLLKSVLNTPLLGTTGELTVEAMQIAKNAKKDV